MPEKTITITMPEAHYERILKAQQLIADKLDDANLSLLDGRCIYLEQEEANEILSAFR